MKRVSPRRRKKDDEKRLVLSPSNPGFISSKTQSQPSSKSSPISVSGSKSSPSVLSPTQLVAGCDASSILEESLTVLHKSMAQAQSDLANDENKTAAATGMESNKMSKSNKDNSAWMTGVFKDLKVEKRKKDSYKNQLKDVLRERLHWLEKQLHSAENAGCLALEIDKSDPSGTVQPSLSRVSTMSTHDNSISDESRVPKVLSPKQEEEGYEIDYQFQQPPRVKELEDELSRTLRQHEQERSDWYKTLEDAAMVTVAGQQLSSQQEQQLRDLQEQFAAQQLQQRKQLKEKSKVLMELLELTEQQQEHERREWEEEIKVYELTISRMSAEKAQVEAQVKSTANELAETQTRLKTLLQERNLLKREKDAAATHLARVSGEKTGWKVDKESYENTVSQLIADKERMRKQIFRLQNIQKDSSSSSCSSVSSSNSAKIPLVAKGQRASKLEVDLDRVTSERDLSRQEAQQLREQLDKELEETAKLNHQVELAVERFDKERSEWEEKLAALEEEVKEARDSVEKEVVDRLEEVVRERQESAVAHAMERSDDEWVAKYEESIQKRNELVARLRKMEGQRDKEKGEWKLKLEEALAKSRQLENVTEELRAALEEQSQQHDEELNRLQERLTTQRNEFVTQISELTEERNSEANNRLDERLKVIEEDLKRQLDLLRDNHSKETNDLENKVKKLEQENVNVKTELETKKCALEKLDGEIAKLRKELSEKKDHIAVLQAENEQDREDMRKEASEIESRHEREIQRRKSHLLHSEAEVRVLTDHVNDLKSRLKDAMHLKDQNEAQAEELRALKAEMGHASHSVMSTSSEAAEWKELAKKSQEEARRLSNRVEELRDERERLEAQLEQMRLERDRYRYDRKFDDRDRTEASVDELTLNRHRDTICEAIEELRQDVVAVRETIETSKGADESIANANFEALRNNLDQLQTNLNDVCAEVTLEVEAMYETREVIELLAKGSSENTDFSKLQDFFSKIDELNKTVEKVIDSRSDIDVDVIRKELVFQLQSKDAELMKCSAELEEIVTLFEAEIKKRQKAEAEVKTLNDQADAYTEELMHLQADNARLNVTLKEAEHKMVSILYRKGNEASPGASKQNKRSDGDDSLPLLQGALALAESLSDIVQGRNGEGKETSVMEMLESLSQKMELHDRGELPGQIKYEESEKKSVDIHSLSPLSIDDDLRKLNLYSDFVSNIASPERVTEGPPNPVETPLEIKIPCSSAAGGQITVLSPVGQSLQLMVEQLYGRCQLLERERLELMETTLDLLESARQSSKAELSAALATAKRKATEDVLRVCDANNKERERLYHKLCQKCIGTVPC